jgi:hypothetical protein
MPEEIKLRPETERFHQFMRWINSSSSRYINRNIDGKESDVEEDEDLNWFWMIFQLHYEPKE